MLEVRIKRILDSIIDVAYEGESPALLKALKGYYITVQRKELRTRGGYYSTSERRIYLHNIAGGDDYFAFGCLHELAHHADNVVNGYCSNHQPPFYAEYKKLVFAALDMGLMKRETYEINRHGYANEKRIIQKWIREYVPKERAVEQPTETQVVKVYHAYPIKDYLKNRGYHWNKIEQTWELEVQDTAAEEAYLALHKLNKEKSDNKTYYTIEKPNLYVNAMIYIVASGNTYDCKEVLKEYGFYYQKQAKTWTKKVPADELKQSLSQIRSDERIKGVRLSVRKGER